MKIQGRAIDISKNYLDPVTYVPPHTKGNANHKDAQQGVIIKRNEKYVYVLFCQGRTIRAVYPNHLIWG